MKKLKFYIIASVLGLLNVFTGDISAKFVENKRFPYFYNQADHLVDGIHWFKSKTNPEEVFYTLPREIDLADEKKWKLVCGENNKFLKELKKCYYLRMKLDNDLQEVIPRFYYDKYEEDFYKYLYEIYQKASSHRGKLPENLLFDNPLDNLGWFYNGLGEGNDLIDRVRKSDRKDNNITELNMFAINTGKNDQMAFKNPKSLEIYNNESVKNIYQLFKDNAYIQHGHKTTPYVIDNYSNIQKLGIEYQGLTFTHDLPLQNQRHVFFSYVFPGKEKKNKYSGYYPNWKIIDNSKLFELPLINVSKDMKNNAGLNCYIGNPDDVLLMLVCDLIVYGNNDLNGSDNSESKILNLLFEDHENHSYDTIQTEFTKNEVRIPVYIFADEWFAPKEYFHAGKEFFIEGQKYKKIYESNMKNVEKIELVKKLRNEKFNIDF